MQEKAELRERFKVIAKEFFSTHDAAALLTEHERITAALRNHSLAHLQPAARHSAKVAVYQPMKVELPARDIVTACDAFTEVTYLYPQVDHGNMWFADAAGNIADPDVVIVPGLFVDAEGNRLGRGKGYYDRFLSQTNIPLTHRIFLGYAFQFIEQVPVTTQDQPVTPVPYES
jgi:5-formyltetrahydrofolate cyclo-ligase